MQERITSREFAEWMAYARLEPFGEDRADYRNAMLMSLIHNLTAKPEDAKDVTDFLPRFGVEPEELEAEQAEKVADKAINILSMFARRNGNAG